MSDNTPREPSASFLECVALYERWGEIDDDDQADLAMLDYDTARDRFLAEPVTSWQRVSEIASIWRLEQWKGDEKQGEPKDPEVERALWKAIETMSKGGVNV